VHITGFLKPLLGCSYVELTIPVHHGLKIINTWCHFLKKLLGNTSLWDRAVLSDRDEKILANDSFLVGL
jgi:hypothetical protein